MLQLRAYVPPERAESIQQQLAAVAGVRHVIVGGRTAGNLTQLTGELDVDVADVVLELLHDGDLAADDVVLWRTTSIEPLGWRRRRSASGRDSAVWAEVTGRAAQHARTALQYVLFMAAAGVVAGVGVLDGSSILVVGAMALSPDLLPISAAAVGLVERRWALAARAALTLCIGLGITTLTAAGVDGAAADRRADRSAASNSPTPCSDRRSPRSGRAPCSSPWRPAWRGCWRTRRPVARQSGSPSR